MCSPDDTLIMVTWGIHTSDGTLISDGMATIRLDGTGLAYVADGKGVECRLDWIAASC